MSNHDGQQVARIPSDRDRGFHHGPVETHSTNKHIEVVAFTGTEESDILHAAGDWMKDHPMAQIRGLNLHEEDIDGPGDARTWVLEMTVDNTAAHF
ncbi:hypothetical protein [Kitasatospora sp. NPDC018614]|uniref:hypothetical protein n=1 Tax=Kitasatospora sp. NPDC018614 TaxID=3364026 RepID=UPI00379B62E7